MKKQKIGFFRKQYSESWKYIVESRNYIYLGLALFIFSSIFGFVMAGQLGFINQYLKEIVNSVSGLSGIQLVIYIFLNNMISSLIGIFFGVIFGIPSMLNAIVNGTVIGYVLNLSYHAAGLSSFWKIVPHGIFELPAIFVSLGLGIKLGAFVFGPERKKEFVRRALASLKVFVYVVLPLLIIAAIIEGMLIFLYK